MSLDQLRAYCAEMKRIQEEYDSTSARKTELGEQLDELRLRKIPELMESMEIKNATYEGIGRVQLATDLYASTKAGQKEQAMVWLRDCGYADMITETYNATSLKALFRRQIAEGIEIPEEIFSVQPFIRASIVKA